MDAKDIALIIMTVGLWYFYWSALELQKVNSKAQDELKAGLDLMNDQADRIKSQDKTIFEQEARINTMKERIANLRKELDDVKGRD